MEGDIHGLLVWVGPLAPALAGDIPQPSFDESGQHNDRCGGRVQFRVLQSARSVRDSGLGPWSMVAARPPPEVDITDHLITSRDCEAHTNQLIPNICVDAVIRRFLNSLISFLQHSRW